eukprot:NODE_43_length_33755_cov_1.178542.p31 type:complete len:128 gc:universal NODE_43_length_33755_cov_1.178542:29409-29026(-)
MEMQSWSLCLIVLKGEIYFGAGSECSQCCQKVVIESGEANGYQLMILWIVSTKSVLQLGYNLVLRKILTFILPIMDLILELWLLLLMKILIYQLIRFWRCWVSFLTSRKNGNKSKISTVMTLYLAKT